MRDLPYKRNSITGIHKINRKLKKMAQIKRLREYDSYWIACRVGIGICVFLEIRAVLAKSFVRVHFANFVKFSFNFCGQSGLRLLQRLWRLGRCCWLVVAWKIFAGWILARDYHIENLLKWSSNTMKRAISTEE